MATYSSEKDIQEYLQEGLEEEGSVEKAFDYLLENEVRDVFEMDDWDVPKFTEWKVKFNDVNYQVNIESTGVCESTNEHRILYWKWTVKEI